MRIRELSIRFHLAALILFSSLFVVLLALGGFLLCEHHRQYLNTARLADAMADSYSSAALPSLLARDPRSASAIAVAIASAPGVVSVRLLATDGAVLAACSKPDADTGHSGWPGFSAWGQATVRHIVRTGQRPAGVLEITRGLSGFNPILGPDARTLSLIFFSSLLLTFLAAMYAVRWIVDPLAHLAGMAKMVTSKGDYSIRASMPAWGETAVLVRSFNEMMAHMESRGSALKDSEERYALAAQGANDGLWDWNRVTGQILFSPRWNYMLGIQDSEPWSSPEDWFSRIHPEDRDRVLAAIEAHCQGVTAEFSSEYRMRHATGGYIWTHSRGLAVRDASGRAIRIAGSQTDVTEAKIADDLTQIPNRLYFLDRLEFAIEVARQTGSQFAVLFIDLDKFKCVNDHLGHAAGDAVLKAVAGRLRNCVRTRSRQGCKSESVVARLGGDEFAVLLSPIHNIGNAETVAARILAKLNEPFQCEGHSIPIMASIGITLGPGNDGAEALLRNADTAMYCSKTNGRNRAEIFDEGMREQAVSRFRIESELRHAIGAGQLRLHYQPIVVADTGKIRGFEALVRWYHPERGVIPPGDFIPVAEESGLILEVGQWVLRQACTQMAEWQRRDPAFRSMTVSVNVSTREIKDDAWVDAIEAVLNDTGLKAHSLVLEMTESSMMGQTDKTITMFRRLKALGVHLEIDDFGTGYSCLSYLQRLPFDTLKVDATFVREIRSGNHTDNIVRAILSLAESLHMDVVAEGVETEAQREALVRWGCPYLQGYLFAKPLEAGKAGQIVSRSGFLGQPFTPAPREVLALAS